MEAKAYGIIIEVVSLFAANKFSHKLFVTKSLFHIVHFHSYLYKLCN
jgi:hypothetical protein